MSISRIIIIAQNTSLEAVRQKFFNFLLILSIGLLASSYLFRQFDFGKSELKFIFDFGYGAIFMFGSILSIVAAAQLFFTEIENRTALTLLAKPIRRSEFLIGKFLGISFVVFIFTLVMTGLLEGFLAWRESALMEAKPYDFPDGRTIDYLGLAIFGLLQFIRFGVLIAITIFISSFSNTNLYSVIVSFFVMLICQLQYIALDSWQKLESTLWQSIVWFLSKLFPNFQIFNVGETLMAVEDTRLGYEDYGYIALYGVGYIIVYLALAIFNFRKREI